MTRDAIETALRTIFLERFEIEEVALDDDLRDKHEFDSIDAIELLREIEILLGRELTRPEKKAAMDIRTLGHIIDYVNDLAASGGGPPEKTPKKSAGGP